MKNWLDKAKNVGKEAMGSVAKTASEVTENVKEKMDSTEFYMTFTVGNPSTAVAELDEGLNSLLKEYKHVKIESMAQFDTELVVVVRITK